MITPDMKIYDIVKQYPQLLDVLIEQSPKFIKLKNKIVFNTMAKLTNVNDAAKIGNIDANDLLLALNKSIGKEEEYHAVRNEVLENFEHNLSFEDDVNEQWQNEKDSFEVLDVREFEDDPFNVIMDLAKRTNKGEGFCIIQKFEPIPLFNALKRRGFEHFLEKVSDEEYKAYFYKK